MNWVISKSKLLSCHTYLNEVLKPLLDDISRLQWLISDLEYSELHKDFPLDMDTDYFVLPPIEFEKILEQKYVQIICGVFIGIPNNIPVHVDVIPSAEFNDQLWKNGNMQHPDAIIEITCFDSGYTIVKFADISMSNKFKAYFGNEAVKLENL